MGKTKLLTKKRKQFIWRFWGYLLLPVIAVAIWSTQVGAAPIAIMSGLGAVYMFMLAPVPCGAPIRERGRDGEELYCRRNARGILGGCNQNRQHGWANAKLLASRSKWGEFLRRVLADGKGFAASVSALATSGATIIALGALIVSLLK
ncbi:hypothetical protein [Pseudonocardia sp. ICBG162]|uniref:hypothetical protein n=1 Tax=Pseudonocardia sp. ICBG162 TaxID=2846761 RepID=UPI001CF6FE37|nr:hypothetical protein [Pseudonocardia sp. ICBG162]